MAGNAGSRGRKAPLIYRCSRNGTRRRLIRRGLHCSQRGWRKATAVRRRQAGSGVALELRNSPVARRADSETALRRLAPAIPAHEFGAVVDHALDSPGLHGAMPEEAAWLALVA